MLARQPQARLWNRTNSNFPKTQGPVARKKSQKATQILRAGNVLPTPRGNPRKWGPGPTPPVRGRWPEGPEGVGWATMSTKRSSGAVPGGALPNPSLLPAKPSEAGSPGRGGARERTQFSPPGGNGVEWTQGELARRDKRRWPGPLRRRAAMGKVGRRPQVAKSPMKRSPLRSGHRVVAQASFFDPAGQFIFSHPTEKPNLSFPARLFLTTLERKI